MSVSNVNDSTGTVSIVKPSNSSSDSNFFTAMANAWGKTLDRQAGKLQNLATEIGDNGQDKPGMVTQLSAESLRMSFLSQSAHTSLGSLGSALETMARKQ